MARLQINSYEGFAKGSNLAHPSHEIDDDFARYIQDAWVHRDGETRRRGPLTEVAMASLSTKLCGIVAATDPTGQSRVAIIHGDGSNLYLGVLSADYQSRVDVPITGATLSTAPYPIVDSKPALGGGAWIGLSSQYDADATAQRLIHWHGGNKADYTTGTITTTYGSKTVTGVGTAWTTNLVPGMFLMSSTSQYIGLVVSIESDTSLTIEEGPLAQVAGATYTATSIRGWAPRITTGHITAGTGSTAITGANTKFVDQGVANGWILFRKSDMALIGTVNTVTNNLALVLNANAAVAMASDDYVLVNPSANYDATTSGTHPKVGFLNAVYQGLQWYANLARKPDAGGDFVNRIWFSSPDNPEEVDLSTIDGDYIPIISPKGTNSPIKALIPGYNSLLILKENEAFVLTGDKPSNFQVKKLADDGVLSGMSAIPTESGVLWAGRNGIYFYDGVEAENIVEDTLGAYYQASVKGFDPRTYRMWGMVHRDHYFLHIERVTPSAPVIKGSVSSTPTQFTIVIYLPRDAVTFFTNLNHRGGVILPASTGQNAWMIFNTSTAGKVCSVDTILDGDGNDAFACDGGTAGPDFYIESKKYSVGDGHIKKLWKQVQAHYLVGGDALKLDTVTGLNTIGATAITEWPVTVYTWDRIATSFPSWDSLANSHPTWDSLTESIYFIKRIKFLKRSQYLAFRIYQKSTSVNKAILGPFALGYKLQRPGRI